MKILRQIWAILRAEAEAISALVAVITLGALILAYISLKNTENAVQANIMLQLQEDARELHGEVFEDSEIERFIVHSGTPVDFDPDVVQRGNALIGKLVRFYASLERLNNYGYLDQSYWTHSIEDICKLRKSDRFRLYWDERVAPESAQYRDEFKALAKRCSDDES